nr:MAG TPA: hypothetical protein [Crassvirales sp.]
MNIFISISIYIYGSSINNFGITRSNCNHNFKFKRTSLIRSGFGCTKCYKNNLNREDFFITRFIHGKNLSKLFTNKYFRKSRITCNSSDVFSYSFT